MFHVNYMVSWITEPSTISHQEVFKRKNSTNFKVAEPCLPWLLRATPLQIPAPYGCFQKWGYPRIDGLQWKTLLKWMIWGYPYFWKHPYHDITHPWMVVKTATRMRSNEGSSCLAFPNSPENVFLPGPSKGCQMVLRGVN